MARSAVFSLCAFFASVLLLGACGPITVKLPTFGPDPKEEGDKPKAPEDAVVLPAFPREDRLLPFYVGGASRNRFFIDPASLSVVQHDLVRYTVVIRSPAGAQNVIYEGLNCSKQEYKVYAFGRNNGTWTEARKPGWRFIDVDDANPYRAVLFDNFFCPRKIPVRNSAEAVRAVKGGGHWRVEGGTAGGD